MSGGVPDAGAVDTGAVGADTVDAGTVDAGTVDADTVDADIVDAVLTGSRALIAVATKLLGAAAEETTIAQYRALVVLASRGPQRLVDLSSALGVAPSTAGRMCDRLVRKGLIRRHRARSDRRAVLVSIMAPGRDVVDQATARRRELIAGILAPLPPSRQREVATALRTFAEAAGEIPDSDWPPVPFDEPAAPPPTTRRPTARPTGSPTKGRS